MIWSMHGGDDDGELVAAGGSVRPYEAAAVLTPSAADRRRSPRVEHRASVMLSRWTGKPGGVPTPVLLRDYSRTGLGVLHRRPLGLSERYVLRVGEGSGGRPLSDPCVIACEVVRCQSAAPVVSAGSEWFMAGLEFLGPVSADLLRQWLAFAAPAGMTPERWDGMG